MNRLCRLQSAQCRVMVVVILRRHRSLLRGLMLLDILNDWRSAGSAGLEDGARISTGGYRGFGGGFGFGTPVVSYAPLPMLRVVCVGLVIMERSEQMISVRLRKGGERDLIGKGLTHVCSRLPRRRASKNRCESHQVCCTKTLPVTAAQQELLYGFCRVCVCVVWRGEPGVGM